MKLDECMFTKKITERGWLGENGGKNNDNGGSELVGKLSSVFRVC